MRREWTPEELIECWTLVEADWSLVANKAGATRLGFAVMLKFFEMEGRFPRHGGSKVSSVSKFLPEWYGGDVTINGMELSGSSVMASELCSKTRSRYLPGTRATAVSVDQIGALRPRA